MMYDMLIKNMLIIDVKFDCSNIINEECNNYYPKTPPSSPVSLDDVKESIFTKEYKIFLEKLYKNICITSDQIENNI